MVDELSNNKQNEINKEENSIQQIAKPHAERAGESVDKIVEGEPINSEIDTSNFTPFSHILTPFSSNIDLTIKINPSVESDMVAVTHNQLKNVTQSGYLEMFHRPFPQYTAKYKHIEDTIYDKDGDPVPVDERAVSNMRVLVNLYKERK